MKFILHEVKLWFKGEDSFSKSYELLPDRINVITGDATTGKTSFWSIIDYCLMSGRTNIANTINEKVSWYGIRFTINNKEIAIARKSPQMDVASPEVYFNYGTLPSQPLENNQIAEIKSTLDVEFGITDNLRFPYGKNLGKTSFNLSYRHFLLFNSLTEDIIGTSKTYFDTTFYGKEEYDKALSHIFDLVIGVNDMENIKAQERINQINSELKRIQSLEVQKGKAEKKFERDIFYIVEKLKERGFIDYSSVIDSLEEANLIINEVIANSKKTANNSQLFAEIDSLNKQRVNIKVQLSAFDKYRREFETYKRGLNKSADSLKPIEFLNKNLSDQLLESYETKVFIDSLEESLRTIQENLSKKAIEPLRVTGDAKALQEELEKIEHRINQLNQIQKNYQTEGEKFIVIGEIKNAYEQILKRDKIKPIDTVRLNQLNEEKSNLEKNLKDIEQVRFTMKNSLNKCIQRNYNQLISLPAYKNSKTQFNDSEMILQLIPEGQLFPLENVGSKSNYMFMHLCFYLGLHEHMINVGQIHVPQFIFIDQPSIPYYTSNEKIGNNDKTKLLDAFSLLNSFISHLTSDKKESFQLFMVEHAPKDYWIDNNLTNFHTVDEFINGKGLIPSNIYND
jgi:hypothetical protein